MEELAQAVEQEVVWEGPSEEPPNMQLVGAKTVMVEVVAAEVEAAVVAAEGGVQRFAEAPTLEVNDEDRKDAEEDGLFVKGMQHSRAQPGSVREQRRASSDVGTLFDNIADLRAERAATEPFEPLLPEDVSSLVQVLQTAPPATLTLISVDGVVSARETLATLQGKMRTMASLTSLTQGETSKPAHIDDWVAIGGLRDDARRALFVELIAAEKQQLIAWGVTTADDKLVDNQVAAFEEAYGVSTRAIERMLSVRGSSLVEAAKELAVVEVPEALAALDQWLARHSSARVAARTDECMAYVRSSLTHAGGALDPDAEREAAMRLHSAIEEAFSAIEEERSVLRNRSHSNPIDDLHASAAIALLRAAHTKAQRLQGSAIELKTRIEILGNWREEQSALHPWLERRPSRARYLKACRDAQIKHAEADTADATSSRLQQLADVEQGALDAAAVKREESARLALEAEQTCEQVAGEILQSVGEHFPELSIEDSQGWADSACAEAVRAFRSRFIFAFRSCAALAAAQRQTPLPSRMTSGSPSSESQRGGQQECAVDMQLEKSPPFSPPPSGLSHARGVERGGRSASFEDQLAVDVGKLVADGHKANARGDYHGARRRFLEVYALHRKPSAMISAANMALKAGDIEVAQSSYLELLRTSVLSQAEVEVVQRKLADVAEAQRKQSAGES